MLVSEKKKRMLDRSKYQLSNIAVLSRNLESKRKVESSKVFKPKHPETEDRGSKLQSREVGT